MAIKWKKHSVLPGLNLSLGYTVLYICLIVLIPFSALILKSAELGWAEYWKVLSSPRVLKSFQLTFTTSLYAALVNMVFGFIIAWFLVRVPFPGKRFIDAIIDLPFALPTAVSGIALTAIYTPNGLLGKPLASMGISVAFTPIGITIALILIGLPFVVRTVQPALEELEVELEEAAGSLGANAWQTFTRITFPLLLPSLLTGFTLAFARSLGEYGSVVFIAGNMPMKTEITSLLIITKLEQYDYVGATVIAVGMLLASFAFLFLINRFQDWTSRRLQGR